MTHTQHIMVVFACRSGGALFSLQSEFKEVVVCMRVTINDLKKPTNRDRALAAHARGHCGSGMPYDAV
jgi:hypothetical protein